MRIGITGPAKSGKTTLFNLLTGSALETGKFAPSLEEVHQGRATVPDARLVRVREIAGSKTATLNSIDFYDFGGISLGGERESKLLGELRAQDVLVLVLRAFEDPELPHAAGSVDPARDAGSQMAEMILNDLIVVEGRLPRLESQLGKMRSKELEHEREALLKAKEWLESDRALRELDLDDEEQRLLRGYGFLSAKPLLLALNVGEGEIESIESGDAVSRLGAAAKPGVAACPFCATLEEEISRLEDGEQEELMNGLGLKDSGSRRMLRSTYELLNLLTFFTCNAKESRAWPLRKGATALQAAGAVHSDMARGFIRAEVVAFADLHAAASFAALRHKGMLRTEGKEYPVADGDVINFLFNV